MLGIIKAMMSRPEPKKEYIKLWNMAFKNDKKSKLMLPMAGNLKVMLRRKPKANWSAAIMSMSHKP